MAQGGSSDMLEKMRDALKRAAQSLQAVKEENKRLHDQLDDANATIMELQLELAALKKRVHGVEQAETGETAPASPPTKRAKAAQARRQSKKSQVTSAVQSWLAPAALLPQVSLPKPEASPIPAEAEPADLGRRRPAPRVEGSPQAEVEPAKEENAREAPPQPPVVARSGFFSGITAQNATYLGSDTSDEETGEPLGEPRGELAVLGEEEAAAAEEQLVPVADNAAAPEEAGLQAIDVPSMQTHSKFVSLLLRQLSMANYARVAHHLATDKRAQNVDVIVAELLSYLRDQCQDLPQPYADYIHEVLPHGADQAQTMISTPWLTRACEKALALPAREPLLSAASCVVQLALAISRHPSKGLAFYDQVIDQLSREMLSQSASSNVVGLKARAWELAEAEDEDRDGYDEYKFADQPSLPADGGVAETAARAEVPMESDHESNADSYEFLDVEVLPGGNGSTHDGSAAGTESAVRSEVASVFAELDALSDSDEEEEEESEADASGETTSANGSDGIPASSEPPTPQPVPIPAPKLQQTTLRKERADWRVALLTAVVFKLHQSRPLPCDDKAKVLVWDVLKASVPHIPSGFLYGLAIAAPELHSTIDLAASFTGAPSLLSTSQVAGVCVLACLRQVLTTAARRPRERFWLFRFLGFLAEWQKGGDSGQNRIHELIETLVSTDLPALYSQLASMVRTMIEIASADSPQAHRAGADSARHALQSTLRSKQLTRGVLNEIRSRRNSSGGHGETMFDPAFQIACRALGWIPTLQLLEELGVLERAGVCSQLRSLFLREHVPWIHGNGQIVLSRTLPPSVATFRAATSLGSPASGLVESWAFQSMDLAKLAAAGGGDQDLQQFLHAVEVVLSAVSAWSSLLPDAFPHAAALSPATAGNCPLELGLELPAAQLKPATQEEMGGVNVTLSGGAVQADRIEVVFYDSQYSANSHPAVSSGQLPVAGAFTARQVAAVPLVALLRTRCLVRALARKVLEITSLQEGSGSRTFKQLAFCAARYLLLFDDQPAAVRADLLDQVLQAMRSVYEQLGSEAAHVPRHLLRFTSHTLSTRAVGHVINLDRRPDRWHRMLKMARKTPLLLYRHAAVDGSKGDRGISERDVTLSWDSFVNAKFDEKCVASTNVTMSPSERACAASHLQLWRDFDSGKLCGLQAGRFDSPIMLVFEDDAKVKTENLTERIADILTELPSNFDICYLGCIVPSNAKRIKWSSQLVVPEYAWQLHAYLLSRAGARKLLNQLPISAPVDNFVAELAMTGMLHTFAVKQSLVTQHKVVSQQAARGSIDTDIRHSGRIVGAGVFS